MTKYIELVCDVCGVTWGAIALHRYDDNAPEKMRSLCKKCFEARV